MLSAFGLSPEIRVLIRPFSTFRQLASTSSEHPWLLVRRPALWLLALGVFVSLTTAGRLVWFHLLGAAFAWSFVPALQIFWLWWVVRIWAPGQSWPKAVDLFFVSQAPWLVFLTAMGGVCIFTPDTWRALEWLLMSGILPGALVLTLAWGILVTHACFRAGFGLEPLRAALATASWYSGYAGSLLLYYWATGQLPPLLLAIQ